MAEILAARWEKEKMRSSKNSRNILSQHRSMVDDLDIARQSVDDCLALCPVVWVFGGPVDVELDVT